MTNKQLINARWKFTDERLKDTHKKFKRIFNDIQLELVELFKVLDVKREDLNKIISKEEKRRYEIKKRDWEESEIITPYFQFLIDSTKKLTYSNILKIYILAIYLKYKKKECDECKSLFIAVANDIYKKAQKDLRIERDQDLLWKTIRDWTIVQTINVPFEQYLEVLCQTDSEEMSKLFINSINQELVLTISRCHVLIEKQLNRLISINEEKHSGVIENITRQVGNLAYIEPFPNQKVRFVAEMDDRTTKMCMSMNDYVFNTKDRNIFYRYSDEAKTKVKYDIEGLQLGINLPPIMDHFHYCRSILTYQV